MDYQKITPKLIKKIEEIVDRKNILMHPEDIEPYCHDETPGLNFPPELVVKVKNHTQVAQLLEFCNKEKIPITPRGGGTGLTGGAVPLKGGIVVSFEKMDRIKDIDAKNYMVVLEPGVINGTLQRELAREGLFYPVNPASLDSCTIGGNVAEASSGANAVKYGGTKEYVSGLEAALPSGEVIKSGGKLVKNVTDYRLIQLLVGSEGTLAAITEIILKVIPLPEVRIDLIAGLNKLSSIENILHKIWKRKIIPASIEYIDEAAVRITRDYVQEAPSLPDCSHYIIIGVDGREEEVNRDMEILDEIFTEESIQDVLVAGDRQDQDKLWKFRQSVRDALVHSGSMMVEEDMVVPRSRIIEFMEKSKKVYRNCNIKTAIYGHLGDGNLHYNFIKTSPGEKEWEQKVEKVLDRLLRMAIFCGGKISGEHGIGLTKKKYLPLVINKAEFELMKKTKIAFDPNNILNPGKIFDL